MFSPLPAPLWTFPCPHPSRQLLEDSFLFSPSLLCPLTLALLDFSISIQTHPRRAHFKENLLDSMFSSYQLISPAPYDKCFQKNCLHSQASLPHLPLILHPNLSSVPLKLHCLSSVPLKLHCQVNSGFHVGKFFSATQFPSLLVAFYLVNYSLLLKTFSSLGIP